MVRWALTACLLVPSATFAFPIKPVTLWSLASNAELIVLAKTETIIKWDYLEGRNQSIAVLKVLERWHGPELDEVRVSFPEQLICPAPPLYIKGEVVLAFLARSDTGWETIGLSYGTLYPHLDELDAWREAVAAVLLLRARGEPTEAERRRWLVETAARAATRWHGVWELNPYPGPLYGPRARTSSSSLNAEETAILARGLAREPTLDEDLIAVLDLLRGHPSRELDAIAVAGMDATMLEGRASFLRHALVVLALERFGRKVIVPKPLTYKELVARIERGIDPSETSWSKATWAKARPSLAVDTTDVVFRPERAPRWRGTTSAP